MSWVIKERQVLQHKKNKKRKLYVLKINGNIQKAVCLVKGKGLRILSKKFIHKNYQEDEDWAEENSMGVFL